MAEPTARHWKRLLPTVSGETRPYWEACARGELLVQRCRACGEYQFYPRGFCAHCWSLDVHWVRSTGRGTVYTFTVTYQNRTPGYQEPYVLALVELEEGVRMFTNIVECEPESVYIGMPVEVVFYQAEGGLAIPCFRPR